MLKITNELMQQIKAAITGQQLKPCFVQASADCSYGCYGTCANGCNATCTADCKSGNGNESSGW